jgi:archaellum biogenesis protein FlaJ (TadC family)
MKQITNKVVHTLILAVFCLDCLFTWAVVSMAPQARCDNRGLPAFTTLCYILRPVLVAIPILAAVYCLWVWCRKGDRLPSWIGFFATTMGFLALVTVPAMLAAYLPLLQFAIFPCSKQ